MFSPRNMSFHDLNQNKIVVNLNRCGRRIYFYRTTGVNVENKRFIWKTDVLTWIRNSGVDYCTSAFHRNSPPRNCWPLHRNQFAIQRQ